MFYKTQSLVARYGTIAIRQENCGKSDRNPLTFHANHNRCEVVRPGTDLERFSLECRNAY
jgi:hypothetical protein